MNASKEECQKMLTILNVGNGDLTDIEKLELKEFLEKAKKKLPSEATYEKDRNRPRKKKVAEYQAEKSKAFSEVYSKTDDDGRGTVDL